VKDPDTIELWLVVARYTPKHKGAKDGFFYFLCDFPNQDLSLETIAQKALQMYRMRWKIEEMHKHIKQEYGWEKNAVDVLCGAEKHEPIAIIDDVLCVFTKKLCS